jgi:4-aminobutyrate aminotransferase-like enzyme
MALRLARAFTGRTRVIKFAGHFHGWHEGLEVGVQAPYEAEPEAGQLAEVVHTVILCPPNDIAAVHTALAAGDVAAVILEPTGGHFGAVPIAPGFLAQLRQATTRAGVVLIFDEVVTGFRVAPGGAQQLFGVIPDLTTLAKILADSRRRRVAVPTSWDFATKATPKNRRTRCTIQGRSMPTLSAAGWPCCRPMAPRSVWLNRRQPDTAR